MSEQGFEFIFSAQMDTKEFESRLQSIGRETAGMLNLVQNATASVVESTINAALRLVGLGAMAAKSIASMWATQPALVPIAVAFYGLTLAQESMAMSELKEEGRKLQLELQRTQQLTRLALSFGGY